MIALKIVRKHKISRRLRKHITILSLFGGEIVDELWKRKRYSKCCMQIAHKSAKKKTTEHKCIDMKAQKVNGKNNNPQQTA